MQLGDHGDLLLPLLSKLFPSYPHAIPLGPWGPVEI
jgi:hypothetical protein